MLAAKPGATQDRPFWPEILVFKVGAKMFAAVNEAGEVGSVNLKCDPDEAEALRAQFRSVKPGYHMNKRHWNTVILDGTVPDNVIAEMVDASYELVVDSLPKSERAALGG